MRGRERRGGLGFGGAVGLGIAAALLIAVIAVGHAVFRQLTGAASVVIVFAEVALCVLLTAAVIAAVGLVVYRGQLARLHLAERRVQLEQLAGRGGLVVAEVLERDHEGGADAMPQGTRPAIQGKRPVSATGSHLWPVPDPADRGDA